MPLNFLPSFFFWSSRAPRIQASKIASSTRESDFGFFVSNYLFLLDAGYRVFLENLFPDQIIEKVVKYCRSLLNRSVEISAFDQWLTRESR
jgi:hypothetical protein